MQEVTSYAEVWIETWCILMGKAKRKVTSYAEVWIETILKPLL